MKICLDYLYVKEDQNLIYAYGHIQVYHRIYLARNILEKILLDKTLYGSPGKSPSKEDERLLSKLDEDNKTSLRMILLVFYNQYFVSTPEQTKQYDDIESIDFPQ